MAIPIFCRARWWMPSTTSWWCIWDRGPWTSDRRVVFPSDQAVLEAAGGKPLGIVGVSPNNLICARLLSRDLKHSLDKSLLVHRIQVALSLRDRLFDQPCYRLIYGDSDLLPGLVVDRFHDHLVVQLASATMERNKDAVLEALVQVLKQIGRASCRERVCQSV